MAKKTIIFKKLIALIMVIIVIFMAYKFIYPGWSSKIFQREQKLEAIKRFGETRISSFSPDVTQDLVDAITGEEDWKIAFEKTVVKETGYLNNPYFIVQTYLFKNRDDSQKILMDKLYLYDDYSLQWIPISEREDLFVNDKFVNSENTDIWSTGNNWVKAYFKDK